MSADDNSGAAVGWLAVALVCLFVLSLTALAAFLLVRAWLATQGIG